MSDDAILEQLVRQQPGLWRGMRNKQADGGIATGFAELDAALPGGGWPNAALLVLQTPLIGCGELRLLTPAMTKLSQQRRLAWISPPYQPYAPGLQQAGIALPNLLIVDCQQTHDIPWAMEKLLRSGACAMALAWPNQRLSAHQVRRLQLAAESSAAMAVLFCTQPGLAAAYAALHLRLYPRQGGVRVEIVKARGSLQRPQLDINWS